MPEESENLKEAFWAFDDLERARKELKEAQAKSREAVDKLTETELITFGSRTNWKGISEL